MPKLSKKMCIPLAHVASIPTQPLKFQKLCKKILNTKKAIFLLRTAGFYAKVYTKFCIPLAHVEHTLNQLLNISDLFLVGFTCNRGIQLFLNFFQH